MSTRKSWLKWIYIVHNTYINSEKIPKIYPHVYKYIYKYICVYVSLSVSEFVYINIWRLISLVQYQIYVNIPSNVFLYLLWCLGAHIYVYMYMCMYGYILGIFSEFIYVLYIVYVHLNQNFCVRKLKKSLKN